MTLRQSNRFFFARFMCALLIVILSGGPTAAYTLRPEVDRAGLEDRLQSRAGLEDRKQKLSELKEKLKAEQAELEALFRSMPPDSGEYQDRQRAIQRIGRLAEIAERLLDNFPQRPDLFDRYVTDLVEPLLRFDHGDVQTLNFILASFRFGNSLERLHYMSSGGGGAMVQEVFQSALSYTSLWEEAQFFFYLPHLPIVVEAQTLSQNGRKKLEEAARLIFASEWRKKRPEALTLLSSQSFPTRILPMNSGVIRGASWMNM